MFYDKATDSKRPIAARRGFWKGLRTLDSLFTEEES